MIEPNVIVDVGSPEHGVVSVVAVDRSDTVAADDVLARLESSTEAAAVKKAKAQANMQAEIKAREATLAFAQRKQERMRDLYASDAISSHQRDEVETELKMAQMQLQQARDSARLARIELERARADLARRTIRSPIAGVVVERFVAPGEYVNEKPLLRVAQMDPLRIETIAPAALFGKIEPGMRARVTTENATTGTLLAEVKIVDRLIDPASGTFGIRLELPNPDHAIPSGLNCQLRIDTDSRRAAIEAAEPVIVTEKDNAPNTVAVARNTTQNQRASEAPASRSGEIERIPAPAPGTTLTTVAQPTDAVTGSPERDGGRLTCASFGPVDNEASAARLLRQLGKTAREIARRSDESAPQEYLVLTMPLDTVDQAKGYAESLRKQGVKDLAVLARDPHAGRISLGLFRDQKHAQARVGEMAALDIETEVLPRWKGKRFWLDVELPADTLAGAPWKRLLPNLKPGDCGAEDYVVANTAATLQDRK